MVAGVQNTKCKHRTRSHREYIALDSLAITVDVVQLRSLEEKNNSHVGYFESHILVCSLLIEIVYFRNIINLTVNLYLSVSLRMRSTVLHLARHCATSHFHKLAPMLFLEG